MNHEDELSDVIVVLVEEPGMTFKEAAAKLQEAGLSPKDIDEPNGVIEGTIETAKIPALRKLEFVKYIRSVFTYVAEFPPGDPRNQDAPPEEELGDVDDAGA